MTGLVDLSPVHLATVEGILAEHVPDCEVRAFGSRAKWSARDASDLDLAIVGDGPLPGRTLTMLKEAFEESRLPMRVDVIDWNAIADSFRESIDLDTVVVQGATLPSDWRQVTFGECAVLVRDTVSPAEEGDVPYVGLEHIGEGTLSLVGSGFATQVASAKSRFKNNDILFGKLRPYFRKVVRVRFDGICSTDIWVIRPAEGVDAGYLFYVIASQEFVDAATRGSEGTRMPRAKWDFVSRIHLSLPPLEEQQAIARVLSAFDDKIELNRCMNETLEETVKALFKSWFVDFDPVRAKLEGRDTGLPWHLADLFPDRLVDSEKGEIPEGWSVGHLRDIAVSQRRGIDPAMVESDTPYIGLKHMPRRSVALTDWEEAGSVSSTKSAFEVGDILFGKLRPYFHKVGIAPVDGLCSTDIVVLTAQVPKWSAFVLACVSSSEFVAYTSQTSTGTKMPRTSWQTMSMYELCRPTDIAVQEFHNAVSPMLGQIIENVHESRALTDFRDTLLTKLISGKIRVQAPTRVVKTVP